ncbi:MAG TPA: DUF5701 family protein [Anaerolineae bacterium]|nr:DUF5701 family protein [Anaerolineae bacterium]
MLTSREFDRQVQNLLQKGYAEVAGLSVEAFLGHLSPLREAVEEIDWGDPDLEKGYLPFVIVVKNEMVATEKAMSLVERESKTGVTKMYPREPQDFVPIEAVRLPVGQVYLLTDIDRGQETLNVAPGEALKIIGEKGRSPLTIEEGVAIVTHYPEYLRKNNCFSLPGSRYRGDKRVPAIWITQEKRANLGWCWEGNPHTWLGSASCGGRVGVSQRETPR